MMKPNIFGAIAALVAMTGVAVAADLPSKRYVVAEPVVAPSTPFFVGINGGYGIDTKNGTVGAVLGYEVNKYLRVEGTYDHYFTDNNVTAGSVTTTGTTTGTVTTTVPARGRANITNTTNTTNTTNVTNTGVKSVFEGTNVIAGNLIGQYPVGYGLTPYALAGIGYRWDALGNDMIYNVGGGVRYAIASNVELDGRYRYVADFKDNRHDNVLTLGMNVKF